MMRTFALLAATLFLVHAYRTEAVADLVGSDNNSDVLLTINSITGVGTQVGSGLGFDFVQGLAFDPNTNTLYGADQGLDVLLTINSTTGIATAVGSGLGVRSRGRPCI